MKILSYLSSGIIQKIKKKGLYYLKNKKIKLAIRQFNRRINIVSF